MAPLTLNLRAFSSFMQPLVLNSPLPGTHMRCHRVPPTRRTHDFNNNKMCAKGALESIAEWFYTFTRVNDWAEVADLDDDVGECKWDMAVDNLFCILQSIFGSCLGNFAIISITRLVTYQRTNSTPLHYITFHYRSSSSSLYYIPPPHSA